MKPSTLVHGKYTIEIGGEGCSVYTFEGEKRVFLCGGVADPEMAMAIVEGLILVEAKKFYVPEANRTVKVEGEEDTPSFLKRN